MKLARIFFFLVIFCVAQTARADEGMWLPQLLERLNESRMKSLGMKISAKDIYSINHGSLKDAVVSLGGFCTAEVISTQGLILTNHHCGFGAIQKHSSIEHNYLHDGFWAMDKRDELPNKDLFVTFIIRIDDVSVEIMQGVTAKMSESERQVVIDKNIDAVRKKYHKEDTQENFVRGFFEGNQYYLFTTETYRDVRLVGAPPSSIGNFGKDSDNWMWPRHTGDFSLFRIYATKENKPAQYAADNVPFVPRKAFNISMSGVKEGDFTMVFGFPGATNEYLHSAAIRQIVEVIDPAKIDIRRRAMNVIDDYMRKDEEIKIQYAAKYASMANYWKKWSGEVLGLTRTRAVDKKMNIEKVFSTRLEANPSWKIKYGNLLKNLSAGYADIEPFSLARDRYNEIFSKIELYGIAMNLNSLVTAYEKNGDNGYSQRLPQVTDYLSSLYKGMNKNVDRDVFEALMPVYKDQPTPFVASVFKNEFNNVDNDFSVFASNFYNENNLLNKDFVFDLLSKPSVEVIDFLNTHSTIRFFKAIQLNYQENVQSKIKDYQDRINEWQRMYMFAQMEVLKERKYYPDANRTLRLTYGNVKGYTPRDGVYYQYSTDLDGVMQKYIPGDYEFDVPEKLRTLYANKDFGPYGENGRMPVCFLATNHTTGGNSGSPVLDAYGNLIGLNFDRVWEGTMSDINYDASICRNIQVDIRYVLFIIDKFADAKHLVDEMKLVYPKAIKKKRGKR